MKSSFLLFSILGALLTTHVLGQTKKVVVKKTTTTKPAEKVSTKTTTTTASATTAASEVPKSSFDKFYDRLSIGYFGVLTSPPLDNWNGNNAAISPEYELGPNCDNCDSYSTNLWSQVNFAYNYGGTMKFNLIPRWTTFFDTPSDQGESERGTFLLEDMLVGFSGVVWSSENKKFNWWMRPGVRLPTSHFSRNYDHPDFGRLTYGLELLQTWSYDFTPSFQVGLTFQDRIWVFENRYNISRHRHLTSPYVSWTVSEGTKIQMYYENMLENNKRYKSINGQRPTYYDVWQNMYIGVSQDVTPKLNVFPFISAYINDVPFAQKSFWLGAWISYSIK